MSIKNFFWNPKLWLLESKAEFSFFKGPSIKSTEEICQHGPQKNRLM